ncbi:hypothetical protein [uncultured Desulfobacter sp.]|uniref:hypothetical protein n=1 Tax=uncultured Desulfobacter sp. TaxID=240139 RepID=UPI002AAA6A68|nr:hypothetical protein [uncultured Desulfobacter sp.]
MKETLGLYAVCYFNNLCDTHLQSFHSLKLPMGAPANAVICFPILKDSPNSLSPAVCSRRRYGVSTLHIIAD